MDEQKRSGLLNRISNTIVQKNRLFFWAFLALLVFSILSFGWVHIEESFTSYLPDSAEAKQGVALMEEQFTTFATASIMVEDTTAEHASELARQISSLDGILRTEFDDSEAHFRDGKALLSVTFGNPDGDDANIPVLEQVKEILREEKTYISTTVGTSMAELMYREMGLALILIVFVVLGVLIFTSSTYAEVPVLVLTFLGAAILNMGTHFLFGTISFVSYSIAVVLQLALSVDYAIIFINRYKEAHETLPIGDAVKVSLAASMREILSSSLTTMAGLLAMTFMDFRLGHDMGTTLIKSIVCSLISVFVFMPCLILRFGTWMDRTKHRNFVPKITPVGRFNYAVRHVMPLVFTAFVVMVCLIFHQTEYSYNAKYQMPLNASEEVIAAYRIDETFGSANVIAAMIPTGSYEAEQGLVGTLKEDPEITGVLSLADIEAMNGVKLGDRITYAEFQALSGVDATSAQALFAYYAAEKGEQDRAAADFPNYTAPLVDIFLFLSEQADSGEIPLQEEQRAQIEELKGILSDARKQLEGADYSRILITTDLPLEGDEVYRLIDRIHETALDYYPEGVTLTGNAVSSYGFHESFHSDSRIVSWLSLSLVFLILLLTFRSFGMALILILVIQGSIWTNFAIPSIRGTPVFFLAYLIVSAIQMGANIDYAIVTSSRYREFRETMEPKAAVIRTVNTVFPTLITSGAMMVFSGFAIALFVSTDVISSMGHYVGVGTLISLTLVLFILPSLLLTGEGLVEFTTFRNRSGTPWFRRRNVRKTAGALACIGVLLLTGTGLVRSLQEDRDTAEMQQDTLQKIASLQTLEQTISDSEEETDARKRDFTEHLVTKNIGQAQLAEGQKAYDDGSALLASSREEYAAGEQQLIQGQQEYDDGTAQLAAAKQTYEEGKAQLEAITPVYNTVIPLYEQYRNAKTAYEEAVQNGDTVRAAALWAPVESARLAFETELLGTGYSITGLVEEYESGLQQLKDGEEQIRQAEQQLAEGKTALDEGYGQLAAGADAIAAGEAKLEEGAVQLEEGKQTLQTNEEALKEDIRILGEHQKRNEELQKGMASLRKDEKIRDAMRSGDGNKEKLSLAADQVQIGERTCRSERCRTIAAAVLLGISLAGVLFYYGKRKRIFSLLSVLGFFGALILWLTGLREEPWILWASLITAVLLLTLFTGNGEQKNGARPYSDIK